MQLIKKKILQSLFHFLFYYIFFHFGMNSILRPVHAKIILRQHIEFLNIHRLQEMNLVETIVCISM